MVPRERVTCGDVGYIISGIKTSKEVKVGDTITHVKRPAKEGYRGLRGGEADGLRGVYPIESEDFENLRASLEKLQLNDASSPSSRSRRRSALASGAASWGCSIWRSCRSDWRGSSIWT